MLISNKPKLVVEVSKDKVWGTGVSLRDVNVLNQNHQNGEGWLSEMLMSIIQEADTGML